MPHNGISDSQKRAKAKYRKTIDHIQIAVPAGKRDAIQARAAILGKSVNAYVTDLIWRDLYGGKAENGGKAESSEKARKAENGEKAESYQKGK